MNENRLKINDTKIEAISFSMGFQLLKWNQNYMIINSGIIETETMICNLGAFLDNSLNYKLYAKTKCPKTMYNLFRTKQNFLPLFHH